VAVDRDIEASLVKALRYTSGDPNSDHAVRASIRAGIVGDDTDLIDIYEREVGPEQAEVDLRLDGPGVENSATNASVLSLCERVE
jgi:hypothetical protein